MKKFVIRIRTIMGHEGVRVVVVEKAENVDDALAQVRKDREANGFLVSASEITITQVDHVVIGRQ